MRAARLRPALALAAALALHLALAWPLSQWPIAVPVPERIMVAVWPAPEMPPPAPTVASVRVPPPAPVPRSVPETAPAAPPEAVVAPVPSVLPMPAPAPPVPVVQASSPTPSRAEPVPVPTVASPAKPDLAPANAEPAPAAIEPPRYQAAYLDNPQPDYPALARKLREQGLVRLSVRVDVEGRPETVRLLASSGFARLDEAALRAVRDWRFEPARQGARPIPAWVEVPIRFNLER